MSTTFNARIEHVSHTTSRVTVRSHMVLVDRPVAKGGRDLGPAGGEYLLVALGGCFTSHLLAASHARDAAISDVRVHVTGTLDGTPERFGAFALDVSATCNDAALARKLIAIAGLLVYDTSRRHAVSRLITGNCDEACTTFGYRSIEDLTAFIDQQLGRAAV